MRNVLIIDRRERVANKMSYLLTDRGYTVLVQEKGHVGLQVLKANRTIDGVLCGPQIGEMGLAMLLRRITEIAPGTPVVVLTHPPPLEVPKYPPHVRYVDPFGVETANLIECHLKEYGKRRRA